jgi:hypothetical protein
MFLKKYFYKFLLVVHLFKKSPNIFFIDFLIKKLETFKHIFHEYFPKKFKKKLSSLLSMIAINFTLIHFNELGDKFN